MHPQNINMYVVARFTFERTLAGDYVPSYTMTTLNLDNSPVNTANLGSTALEFILHLIILYLIYAQSLDMYVRRETYYIYTLGHVRVRGGKYGGKRTHHFVFS